MRHPIILPISSFLPELISVGFLSAVGKVTHWQIFSSWQLACLTIRLPFLWFCFVFVFCLISSICPLSSRMPLSHNLLYVGPRCSRFAEDTTPCGPKLTVAFLSPAAGHILTFSIGWDSGPPDSVPSHPSITLSFPHYSHTVVANGRLWWKIGNCAPFSIQDSELRLSPIVLISIFSSFFPFPLSVYEPNLWMIENYPFFKK